MTIKDFQYANLSQKQLDDLLNVEKEINGTTTDPVYIIAFRKED